VVVTIALLLMLANYGVVQGKAKSLEISMHLCTFDCGDRNIMIRFVFGVETDLDLRVCAPLHSADVTQFALTAFEGFHYRHFIPIKSSRARFAISSDTPRTRSIDIFWLLLANMTKLVYTGSRHRSASCRILLASLECC
jgi:hypothetical protein